MLTRLISTQIDNAMRVFKQRHSCVEFERRIRTPEKQIDIAFTHNNKSYNGFRIQYNSLLGPYKGGIRIDNMVSREECVALSFWMTIKTALFNLPYGGGKGGIIANFRDMSPEEQEGVCRAYVKSLYRDIGPFVDIPAPDLGSTSVMMDWMNDEYKTLTGETTDATFTGKTVARGGSLARTEATGYGVAFVTANYVNKFMNKSGNYILQGFGNVGSHTSLFMNKFLPEYKLTAVGDHTGYYYNANGFDARYLFDYNAKNKSLLGITSDKTLTKSEFFSLNCDIVIPAALELEVDETIAKHLQCKLVVEGANGPLSTQADNILYEKNIALIPDILANAGGVIVSYFEWEQNTQHTKYSFDEVLERLEHKLNDKMNEIYPSNIKDCKRDYRVDCYVNSLSNLYKAF